MVRFEEPKLCEGKSLSMTASERALVKGLNACSEYRESKSSVNHRFERDVKDRLDLGDTYLRLLHKEDVGIMLSLSGDKDDPVYVIQVGEDLGLLFYVLDLSKSFSEGLEEVDYSYFHVTGKEDLFLCMCDMREVEGDGFRVGRDCSVSLLDMYDGKAFFWKD